MCASDHRLIAPTTGRIVCPNSVSWYRRLAAGGLRGRLVLKPAAVAA